jgi:hypothetical protein
MRSVYRITTVLHGLRCHPLSRRFQCGDLLHIGTSRPHSRYSKPLKAWCGLSGNSGSLRSPRAKGLGPRG